MKKTLIILYLSLFLVINIIGQPGIHWASCYGGSGWDNAKSIKQTTDGGYIIAGHTQSNDGDVSGIHGSFGDDCWILKLDNLGGIEWQKCLGGSGPETGFDIQQTTDGGYIVANTSSSDDGDVTGNHGDGDYWVVKLDVSGSIEWQNSFGGSNYDGARSIQQTSDGGYILAGATRSNDGDVVGNHGEADYWLVKINGIGNIEWQKCLGGSGNDIAMSVQQTLDGGYFVAGYASSNDGDVLGNHGEADYWIVKINGIGNIEWQNCLGGSDYDTHGNAQQTIDGGFIVTGWATSIDGDITNSHGGGDNWIVKLNNIGNIEWEKSFGGTDWDMGTSICQTTDGGYITAGKTKSNNGDVSGNHGNSDYWIVKIGEYGNLEWQKCFGGSNDEDAYSIQQTTDGGYIVAGWSKSNDYDVQGNHGVDDFWIVKFCVQNQMSVNIPKPHYCQSTNVYAVGDFNEYLWSTGETTQSITITDGGEYSVIGYNESGCPTEVIFDAPYPLEPFTQSQICIVSLDEITEKNIIVYEPVYDVGIDSIMFYRLNNITSEYECIGSNSINDAGIFVDQAATPSQQNYQYKIAIKDTCNKTSVLSPVHRTILLQANLGVNDEINLFWNAYEGFDYSNFGIYRSSGGAEYFLIANVPNNTYTYIDLYPPSGANKYQIRIEKDPACNPEREVFSFVASNPVVINPDGISESELITFKVYPNPFYDNLIIERDPSVEGIKIDLFDVYGRLLNTFMMNSGESILYYSTDDLLSGFYYLRFNQLNTKCIIKL